MYSFVDYVDYIALLILVLPSRSRSVETSVLLHELFQACALINTVKSLQSEVLSEKGSQNNNRREVLLLSVIVMIAQIFFFAA